MEFKVISPKKEKSLEETAQNALEQIKEKNYKEELIEAGISENNIKAYGFAFEGKKKGRKQWNSNSQKKNINEG